MSRHETNSAAEIDWSRLVADREWRFYQSVLREANERNLPFAIGGGIAFSLYSRRWRNTRDIDLFVKPDDRQTFIDLINRHGFGDYYDLLAYDRAWIYRGHQSGAIIDIIWQMANQRAKVDDGWIAQGTPFNAQGIELRLIPPEELIFAKLYVMQRDRCDWPDLLNVLNVQCERLDWGHLLDRLGDDAPLLSGLMGVFRWICPQRARRIDDEVWRRLSLADMPWGDDHTTLTRRRADLLDSREWFGPNAAHPPRNGEFPC